MIYDNEKRTLITNRHCKKIILTTDQELIKDGVQVVDDDFLMWFMKNTSFEEVEVEELYPSSNFSDIYKIISFK